MRLFGLIGQTLSHSFSKKYFSEKFQREGMADCRYELFPLASVDELPGLLKAQPELEGLNVTIPYKKSVIELLDSTADLPPGLDACNCIRIRGGKTAGFNTDVIAFEKSIETLVKFDHRQALILGNGGATSAVAYVLKKRGIHFHIVSRDIHNGSTLTYKDLNGDIIRQHRFIVNTTPLGMYPDIESFPDIPYRYIGETHLLYDLVYNPPLTEFLKKGKERGAMVKNGEEMLILQAEESWKIWNRK
jgi:shikimate dehydrogenase